MIQPTMNNILERLDNMEENINKLLEKVEKIEEKMDEKYCTFCKTYYSKISYVLGCDNCEKTVCEKCVIERGDKYYCPRKCCNK